MKGWKQLMTLKSIYAYFIEHGHRGRLRNAKFSSCRDTWFQISLIGRNNRPYALGNIHFEIRRSGASFEIHFEENNTTRYQSDKELNELVENSDFNWVRWWSKGPRNHRHPNNKSLRLSEEAMAKIKNEEDFLSLVEKEHARFNDVLLRIADR